MKMHIRRYKKYFRIRKKIYEQSVYLQYIRRLNTEYMEFIIFNYILLYLIYLNIYYIYYIYILGPKRGRITEAGLGTRNTPKSLK